MDEEEQIAADGGDIRLVSGAGDLGGPEDGEPSALRVRVTQAETRELVAAPGKPVRDLARVEPQEKRFGLREVSVKPVAAPGVPERDKPRCSGVSVTAGVPVHDVQDGKPLDEVHGGQAGAVKGGRVLVGVAVR